MSSSAQLTSFSLLIKKHTDILLNIKRRLFYLEAIQVELVNRAGETFAIKNDIVWQLIADSYDMLVIDLCSFCVSLTERKGFFGVLKQHSALLKVPAKGRIETTKAEIYGAHGQAGMDRIREALDESERIRVIEGTRERLRRMFPNWDGKSVKDVDIDELKDRFIVLKTNLAKDRNRNRAHRFENVRGAADRLGIQEIRQIFDSLEGLMNDLTLIAQRSSMEFISTVYAHKDEVAKDLVDMTLMGSMRMVLQKFGIKKMIAGPESEGKFLWQHRKRFYDEAGQTKHDLTSDLPDEL